MTKVEEEIQDLIVDVLDIREKLIEVEGDLESAKYQLLTKLQENNLTSFVCDEGKAKIIAFNRQSLIKDEVLLTFNDINKGLIKNKINVRDYLKSSNICFVLVKGIE